MNVAGGGVTAVFALALIPLEIRQLGLEAYGVISFLASLQVLLSLFDLGLSPATTRYVASSLARGAEASLGPWSFLVPFYGAIGLGLGAAMIASAHWLATDWLQLRGLAPDIATTTIRLGGLALALRWPVSLVAGLMAGLQRFDAINGIKALHAILHFAGCVLVLYAVGTLPALAAWLVISATFELALYGGGAWILWHSVPKDAREAPENVRGAQDLWRYARAVALIGVLSLVLTQSDRLLLARLVPAAELGGYGAAYNLLFGLTLVQLLVGSALYPAFAAGFASENLEQVRTRYRDATRVLMFLYAVPFAVVVLFGRSFLHELTVGSADASTDGVLTLLALGFLFNAATAMPYSLALAGGVVRLPIWVNLANVFWYLPTLALAIVHYGPAGAAAAWALLNASYLLVLIPLIQRRLIHVSLAQWLSHSVVPFPFIALAIFGVSKALLGEPSLTDLRFWLALFASSLVYVAVAAAFLGAGIRGHVRLLLRAAMPGLWLRGPG